MTQPNQSIVHNSPHNPNTCPLCIGVTNASQPNQYEDKGDTMSEPIDELEQIVEGIRDYQRGITTDRLIGINNKDAKQAIEALIQRKENEARNRLWASTYDFLYNHDRDLCDEWVDELHRHTEGEHE